MSLRRIRRASSDSESRPQRREQIVASARSSAARGPDETRLNGCVRSDLAGRCRESGRSVRPKAGRRERRRPSAGAPAPRGTTSAPDRRRIGARDAASRGSRSYRERAAARASRANRKKFARAIFFACASARRIEYATVSTRRDAAIPIFEEGVVNMAKDGKALSKSQTADHLAKSTGTTKKQATQFLDDLDGARLQGREEQLHDSRHRQARAREPQGPHGPQPGDGRRDQDSRQARREVPRLQEGEGRDPGTEEVRPGSRRERAAFGPLFFLCRSRFGRGGGWVILIATMLRRIPGAAARAVRVADPNGGGRARQARLAAHAARRNPREAARLGSGAAGPASGDRTRTRSAATPRSRASSRRSRPRRRASFGSSSRTTGRTRISSA